MRVQLSAEVFRIWFSATSWGVLKFNSQNLSPKRLEDSNRQNRSETGRRGGKVQFPVDKFLQWFYLIRCFPKTTKSSESWKIMNREFEKTALHLFLLHIWNLLKTRVIFRNFTFHILKHISCDFNSSTTVDWTWAWSSREELSSSWHGFTTVTWSLLLSCRSPLLRPRPRGSAVV